MDITCLLPTRGDRKAGIKKCITSIDKNIPIKILEDTVSAHGAVNDVLKDLDTNILIAIDDIEFEPDAIETACDYMNTLYPDMDGVIGFHQIGIKRPCLAAIVLIGSKFISRFPSNRVYCDDYEHYFVDAELYEYADSINKFHFANDASLTHYHPSITGIRDATAIATRERWDRDRTTNIARINNNYLWGKDFKLINE